MRLSRIAALFSTLLSVCVFAQTQDVGNAATGLLISPMIQRVTSRPYSQGSLVFKLNNPGQVVMEAQADVKSFTVEEWTYRTIYADHHARDCASWFSQPSQNMSLDGGKSVELHLNYKVPSQADGAYWAMLRFEPHAPGATGRSPIVYEIPIVIIAGKNQKPKITVNSPVLQKITEASTGFMATVPIENAGEGFSPVSVNGTIKDLISGHVVMESHIDDRNLFPNSKRKLGFFVPNIPDGTYRVVMRPTLGNRTLPTVTSDYRIKKGVAALLSDQVAFSQSPLSIEPGSLSYKIPKGGSRHSQVRIFNRSTKDVTVELSAVPVSESTDGALTVGAGILPKGLKIEMPQTNILVKAGGVAFATLGISVDQAAEGDLWFALSAHELGNAHELTERAMANVAVAGTAKPSIVVEHPVFVKDGDKPVAVRFDVRNSGNTALRPIGTAVVLADGVKLTDRLAVPVVGDGGLLPGAVVANTIMLPPSQKDGSYVVEIEYQYSEKESGKLRIPLELTSIVAGQRAAPKTVSKKRRKP